MAISRSRGGDVVDYTSIDHDVAAGYRLQASDHAKNRALAAPRRPDEHYELAVADLEIKYRV